MILSRGIWTVGSHTVLYLECIINNSDLLVMNMSTTYIIIIIIFGGNFQRQTLSCLDAVEKVIPTSSANVWLCIKPIIIKPGKLFGQDHFCDHNIICTLVNGSSDM